MTNTDLMADVFLPEPKPTDAHVWGSVRSINADGSYEVQLNSSSVTTRCAPCCTAMVGDRVLVLIKADGKCVAAGRLGGEIGGGGEPVVYSQGDVSDWIAGKVFPYAGADEPIGCLPCDGRAVSRREYWELFDAIGTTYGAGDGSSTFNLPNIESRTIIGEGDGYALGATGGEEEHTLTAAEMPNHAHEQHLYASGSEGFAWGTTATGANSSSAGYGGHTAASGGDQPHNNMQPYIVMRYFITTGKGDPVSGINPADYVVEWGNEGYWTWRKYASGYAECWYRGGGKTVPVNTAWGSLFLNGPHQVGDLPFEFTEVETAQISTDGGQGSFAMFDGSMSASSVPDFYILRGSALTANTTFFVNVYVAGWLKEPSASGGTETIAPTIAERFAELEARLAEAEYDTGWQNVYVIDSKIDVKVRRVGKMVTLVGTSWGYVTLPAKGWHSITTLDSEFRPSINVPFTINGMGSFDNELCNSSQIEPDGLVRAYVSKETSYWKFSVSYPVD